VVLLRTRRSLAADAGTGSAGKGFRPDIEGLRAVAVLGVVGYHAALPVMPGGYVGVDVFFVISGYLITGLLLAQIDRAGRFSLAEFYGRRARRILPAAGVVLLVTAVASVLLLPPLRQRDVAYDLLASALNVGNWRFIAVQTNYLAAGQAPSPVLHYWSLGVEEQFYLLWAPLALASALIARRLGRSARVPLAAAIGSIVVASFALSLYWTWHSAPWAYLSSPSRAWQFGCGALGALAAPYLTGRADAGRLWRAASTALGWAGAIAILVAVGWYTNATPFPGYAALLPTLGTLAVILSGGGRPDGAGVGRLLAYRPVRAIGRLSFSWYLWHWPVLVLGEAVLGAQSWPGKLALVTASAIPAWLTMRLVETPVRLSPRVASRPWRSLAVGAAAVAIPLVASLLVTVGADRSMRRDLATMVPADLLVGAVDGPHLLARPPRDLMGLRPGPASARDDLPAIGTCQVEPTSVSSPPCLFGNVSSPHRVVLFGDSHAAQWFPAIRAIAQTRGWAVEVLTKSGCPVPRLTVANGQLGRVYRECDTWRESTILRIASEPRPAAIFVSSERLGYTDDERQLADGWRASLVRLATVGAPIIYLRDTPYPGEDVPACTSGAPRTADACSFSRAAAIPADPIADAIADKTIPSTVVVDLDGLLCPGVRCPTSLDSILLYRDNSHLTATAAALLGPRLDGALRQLLPSS